VSQLCYLLPFIRQHHRLDSEKFIEEMLHVTRISSCRQVCFALNILPTLRSIQAEQVSIATFTYQYTEQYVSADVIAAILPPPKEKQRPMPTAPMASNKSAS
jgi:hypothetical protein